MENSFLRVGRVVKTQGIKGQLKIASSGGSTLSEGKVVYLEGKEGWKKSFTVESSRFQKGMIILSLRGIKRIEEAEGLVGSSVYVEKADLEPLPADEFYWHQLCGLKVETDEGRFLGKLEEIWPTGSNDVLVVRKEGQEILIPATDEVVVRVDLECGVMVIHLLEGLLPEDDI